MAAGFIIGIIALAIVGLVVLGCVVGIGVLWWKVLTAGAAARPRCGRCSYETQGSSTLRCPECGGDYRQVGIETARGGGVPVWAFVLLWTALLPAPALTLWVLLMVVGPKAADNSVDLYLTPNSAAYSEINLDNYGPFFSLGQSAVVNPMWGTQTSATALNLYLHSNTDMASAEVDAANLRFDPGHASSGSSYPAGVTPLNLPSGMRPFDEPALLDLMASVGADPAQPAVIDEAREVLALIATHPAGGLQNPSLSHFSIRSFNTGMNSAPAMWWVFTTLAIGPLVWVAGLVVFLVIHARRQSAAYHEHEANAAVA